MTDPVRVLIVDDHRLLTQALELLLRGEDGIQVVGTAETGEDALEFCRDHPVDVALVDVDLPGMDGIAVTAELQSLQPEIRVVVITAFQAREVMARAVKAGASGYIMKTDVADTLVDAIRLAMTGNMVIPAGRLAPSVSVAVDPEDEDEAAETRPATQTPVSTRRTAGPLSERRTTGPLSEREAEILQAIAEGKSTIEIAGAFDISEHTVRTYVKRILAKLDVHSKAEAVMHGVRLGLIQTGS